MILLFCGPTGHFSSKPKNCPVGFVAIVSTSLSYACKNRRVVSGRPCSFHTYIRQDDINAEVYEIVRKIFDRESVNESVAKDFLSAQLDMDALREELKALSGQLKEVRSRKDRMLSKIAEMDPDDPLYDEMYENYNGLIRGFISHIADLEAQMDEVRSKIDMNGQQQASVEQLTQNVSSMWSRLDTLEDAVVKEFLNTYIDRVEILEQPDKIDDMNFWVKSVKVKVPFNRGQDGEYDTLDVEHVFQPKEGHDETVVSLSQLKSEV